MIATVLVNVLPGDNKFDQLSLINTCFLNKSDFINLDWKFYNGNANIFIEFNNRKLLLSAIDEVLMTHSNIPFNILNQDTSLPSNPNAPIYRLKMVPTTISHQHIKRALSYYRLIETLEDKFRNRYNSSQDVIITFKRLTKPHQLNLTWAHNSHGLVLRCVHIDTSIEDLKARNSFVAGFKGFPNKTTPAEAFRSMRPHEACSCYFHNNIAYFAFSNESDMHQACSARILHNGYKLDGRSRILSRSYNPTQQNISGHNPNLNKRYNRRNSVFHKSGSQINVDQYASSSYTASNVPVAIISKRKNKDSFHPPPFNTNVDLLTAILNKLQELDSIKTHLAKLDAQFLTFSNHDGAIA
jgi:hypothetical protein